MQSTNPLPANTEAEAALLGSLLIDPNAIDQVAPILAVDDFYSSQHKLIYNVFYQRHQDNQPTDILLLEQHLQAHHQDQAAGGFGYLQGLIDACPSSANIMSYATAIATSSTYRRLIKASGQIASLAYSKPTDPGDAIATAASLIQDIAHHQNNKSFITIADAATKAWDKIGEAHLNPNSIMGIPTGIAPLDTITHGLQDSDLIIIAGRPGVGKTAFAMTIVQHAVLKANVPTAVFSMEMSATQLATRMISSVASMDSQRIKTGDISSFEMERITRAVGTLHEAPLYIDDTAGLSTIDLRSRCKQMVLQHDIKLIVIDYLQLMYASTTKGGGHRTQEVAEISRTLKGIAREYNLPVIALSQLNRQIEMRPGKTPQLSDLRESGSIEQDADIVMFLSRDTLESEATDNDKLTELVIAKHRNGPVATIGLRFVKEQTTFVELT